MKRLILTILKGSFAEGFPVRLEILAQHGSAVGKIQEVGQLPPCLEVPFAFERWEDAYRLMSWLMSANFFRITANTSMPSNISISALAEAFTLEFKKWLKSPDWEWQKIRECLLKNLNTREEILVIVETQDPLLQRLPWNLWDLFNETFVNAEIAIASASYKPAPPSLPRARPRLLAVLGNNSANANSENNTLNLDLEEDRKILKQELSKVNLHFAPQPSLEELTKKLWEQSWDILYFAGHSSSKINGNGGFLQLRGADVPIEYLKYALDGAVRKGLRLAIFNSCDGLGLARELAELHIPQVVVMREPIPDKVAHEFLKFFLKAFSSGQSLYQSVQTARKRLQGLENSFPCASWLPVICQNPAELPLPPPQASLWQRSRPVLLVSIAIALATLGLRQIGLFQPLELQTLDRLQSFRPQEAPDSRILVVTITESDIQKRKEWPLADRTLAQLLATLDRSQPRVIGLDLYRDFPVPNNDEEGTRLLQPHLLNPRLISICKESTQTERGVGALALVSPERLGFSDVVVDSDGVVRRHLLFMQPEVNSVCPTMEAFSLQLALRYLAREGIKPALTAQEQYKLQDAIFKPLSRNRGIYRNADTRGYQTLLNYRVSRSPQSVAEQVTLSEVLEGKFLHPKIKDKIVLIGVTAETVKDDFQAPYSAVYPQQRLPGVLVQAQLTSQILSAALDERPLFWFCPDWVEGVWIVGWSVVGGVVAIAVRSRLLFLAVLGSAVMVLVAICWGCLSVYGLLLPLVPPVFVLIGAGCVVFLVRLQSFSQNKIIFETLIRRY